MQPLDEVRSGTAIFDETLFRLAPSVYRALDLALQGDRSGSQLPEAPAFLRFGSWIGADRDGNPFVTATVTAADRAHPGRPRAARAGERGHQDRPVADRRRGAPGGVRRRPRRARRGRRHRRAGRGPRGADRGAAGIARLSSCRAHPASRSAPTCCTRRSGCRRPGCRSPRPTAPARMRRRDSAAAIAYGSAAEFIAELRLLQRALAGAGAPPAGLRRAAAPDLAGGDVRLPPRRARGPPAQRGARRRAARSCGRAAPPSAQTREVLDDHCRDRRDPAAAWRAMRATATSSASPPRPMTSPPCTSWPGYACPDGPPVLDVVPLFESGDDLAHAVSVLDGDRRA